MKIYLADTRIRESNNYYGDEKKYVPDNNLESYFRIKDDRLNINEWKLIRKIRRAKNEKKGVL